MSTEKTYEEVNAVETPTEEKKDRPEPPKDENGNPILPPHGFKPNGEKPEWKEGEMPELPKDEN